MISHLKILDEDLGPINMSITEPEYLEQQRKKNSQLPLIEEKIIQEIQADFERQVVSPGELFETVVGQNSRSFQPGSVLGALDHFSPGRPLDGKKTLGFRFEEI